MQRSRAWTAICALPLALVACGGSSSTPAKTGGQPGAAGAQAGPLSAEAQSAATGDIPDNQAFLTFRNSQAGYSISYPEGWAQQGAGDHVTLQDKSNIVRILVSHQPPPTVSSVTAELERERASDPTLHAGPPATISISGAPVVKATYTTLSPPNPVTGKRVELTVDRYVYSRGGKVATVDLGSPAGVDNVDAYRMMSRSFKWR